MSRGDLTYAELEGVADNVQKNGKLKELADALEVVPQLESLEGDVNAPFELLRCWRLGMENGSEAHSLLVHHLKCIGLQKVSDRYCYNVIMSQKLCGNNLVSLTDSTIDCFLCCLTQLQRLNM